MNTMSRLSTFAASAAVVVLAASSAHAQTPSGQDIYQKGIPGKVTACASCHGAKAEGGGGGQFPRLAGLPAKYVEMQIRDFRDGKRNNAIMAPMAKGLTDEQATAVAQYLTGLNTPYTPAAAPATDVRQAGALMVTVGEPHKGVPACADCHGPTLQGGGPDIPPLAGHTGSYLLAQLKAYKSGDRPAGPIGLMGRVASGLDDAQMKDAAAYIASLKPGERPGIPHVAKSEWKPRPQKPDSFTPPPVTVLPAQPDERKMVLLGERIYDDTPKYASKYVGNKMSCRNCHLNRGRDPVSSPMWAAVPQYPKYRGKNKKVNTFVMRNQGCFRYSENGTPPPAESTVMVALLSYMHWMAQGIPVGIKPKASGYPSIADPPKTPSRERGKGVYAENCAMCHGGDGQGRVVAGQRVFPALWGPESFNWGAGMHRVNTAAAFIRANMPLGAAGTLSVQDDWDVAEWVDSHPRPQDPRYDGNLEQTRKQFHKNEAYDFYGRKVDGLTLGAPGTLAQWAKDHPRDGG